MARILNSGLTARRPRKYTRPVAEPATDPSGPVPADLTTVGDLLDWVGNDADRAQLVLDQENAKDKPRKTLVEPLATVILEA